MLGGALLSASRSPRLRRLVVSTPSTRRVVDRFVAGERLGDAMTAVRRLAGAGLTISLDHLGEDVTSPAQATASRDAYLRALDTVGTAGLGAAVEVSVKLSAFGQSLPGGHDLALANVEAVAAAATDAGTTVTMDMEDSSTVDSTLAVLASLRARFPGTGAVLQSYLHRTPDDARALCGPGSRVRLVKGAYREPASVALQDKRDVDRAYEECLRILMAGSGYPMVGSHDPRMIASAQRAATAAARPADSYEFQMLYGMRTAEQERLVAQGYQVRTYVPYGTDWYGYFMRRLAERPANLLFFARALTTRG
ncbi:proline dehydrogenase family protein [Dactylosporangium sp. NPDC048998]|uniref:proline dehydrogenase family protein n=1 Tax=Dactylosporangium sp. NPDC048998 TaxID=3363976 RepID=UPI0037221027